MKKIKLAAFAVVLVAVSAMNVKTAMNAEHTSDLLNMSLMAMGEGSGSEGGLSGEGGEFPTDPFDGWGSGAQTKRVDNYYYYSAMYVSGSGVGENRLYDVYKTPVTEISCIGWGEVPCTSNVLSGGFIYMGRYSANTVIQFGINI